jgi:hypothetical protein
MTQEGTDVVLREESVPALLVGSPAEKVAQATAIATALAPVIEQRKLYININGKRHVLYEGWATLGALVGVFPITDWTRAIEGGWEARVEARTLGGAVVGAAEAECTRDETRWAKADDYAIRSMAQTRAGSKALRMPLGFIMHLSGFEPTPAEEMPKEDAPASPQPKPRQTRATPKAEAVPSGDGAADWSGLWVEANELGLDRAMVHRLFGVPPELKALKNYAEVRAISGKVPLQVVVDAMRGELAQKAGAR